MLFHIKGAQVQGSWKYNSFSNTHYRSQHHKTWRTLMPSPAGETFYKQPILRKNSLIPDGVTPSLLCCALSGPWGKAAVLQLHLLWCVEREVSRTDCHLQEAGIAKGHKGLEWLLSWETRINFNDTSSFTPRPSYKLHTVACKESLKISFLLEKWH